MKYIYAVAPQEGAVSIQFRETLFQRMQEEGLLPYAMHAYTHPTKEDWLALTNPQKGWLLCCSADEKSHMQAENVRGIAWLAPWQGRVWTFDFTAFREHFSEAVPMSKGALRWIFANVPCDSVMGISARSNRHAWRLAQRAGFQVLGEVEGACYMARKYRYEAGVLVMATRSAFTDSGAFSVGKIVTKSMSSSTSYTALKPRM